MNIGIDASNIRGGGGLTHLSELINHVADDYSELEYVYIWGSQNTLNVFKDYPWLFKKTHVYLNSTLVLRFFWRFWFLDDELKRNKCDILFVPGGSYRGKFKPFVAMSQNLLPFEKEELSRYRVGPQRVRYELLRHVQLATLRKSDGYIFLEHYAEKVFQESYELPSNYTIIPHGVNSRFERLPKTQLSIEDYSFESPYKFLYVSTINLYKHQWNVIEAVARLRDKGYPISLDLVGANGNGIAYRRMVKTSNQFDPESEYIQYHGKVSYDVLDRLYHQAHGFIFASSCENMPNILLEAMLAGLPVICSNRGPMRNILGNSEYYFNPESVDDLAAVIGKFLNQTNDRLEAAEKGHNIAKSYTWDRCSRATLAYLYQVLSRN